MNKLFTIGFTKKSAQEFFTILKNNEVKQLVDVRLNNRSQLAGFTKKDDLRYFLQELCQIGYTHHPMLSPTEELLKSYRKKEVDWKKYEVRFINLMKERRIEQQLDKYQFESACLLCSEHEPEHCHRRLVAEYLQEKWGGFEIIHL